MGTKNSTHHIAIDSQGYVFADSPSRPKRIMQRNTVFGNRFASGDRDYTDLSFWWYWAQTDWVAGFKDRKDWEDDAKYYYSINIDAFSEPGAFTIAYTSTEKVDLTEDILCGINGEVNGVLSSYMGTDDDASSIPRVYRSTNEATWTDISSGSWPNTLNTCNTLFTRKNNVWALFTGLSTTWAICYYDGSSWTECAADIYNGGSTIDHEPLAARAACEVGEDLYISVNNYTNDYVAIVKTSATSPTAVGDWSKVLDTATNGSIIAMEEYSGDVYYLLTSGSNLELRKWDVTNSADSLLQTFRGVSVNNNEFTDRHLHNFNGKLVVTVPNKEIWEYDGTNLTRIWEKDAVKDSIGKIAHGTVIDGAIEYQNRLYWGNLVYDGTYFYNFINAVDEDVDDSHIIFVFVNEADRMFFVDTDNYEKLYRYNTGGYRSGDDKNYLQFSEMEEVSTITKLGYSVNIIFDSFDTGEEIDVRYSIDGGTTFTSIGTASEAIDGTSVTQKTFFFGDAVTFEKIIFRVYLNGDGTSTPKFKDISMQYIPIPDYKYRWSFVLDCSNDIMVLDNKSKSTEKGVDLRHKLQTSFLKRELVELEDIDYAETLINDASPSKNDTTITVDSTDDFPEQGRIKIESEEILYTGKTRTTFTGCTRGYRGTNAEDHADDDAVTNKYKVLITDYKESIPLSNAAKIGEFEVTIEMLEA